MRAWIAALLYLATFMLLFVWSADAAGLPAFVLFLALSVLYAATWLYVTMVSTDRPPSTALAIVGCGAGLALGLLVHLGVHDACLHGTGPQEWWCEDHPPLFEYAPLLVFPVMGVILALLVRPVFRTP